MILSGDSDYVELVSHLKSEGVRVDGVSGLVTTLGVVPILMMNKRIVTL